MAVDIGPKIGIDGEAEFRKELNNITQQLKTYGSEMKAVTAEFGKNQDSMEALTAKNEVLSKSVDAQNQKLEGLKKGLSAAAKEFGETDTKTLKWQQAVNEATAELNRLQNELRSNESAIDNFGKEVEDVGDSLEDAGKEALSFGDILKANLASDFIVESVSAIKDAVVELGSALMEYSRESENATTKATAYFGEVGAAAEQTESVIKDVFTDGVGESMDSVADAVITVKKNLKDLSETDMKNLTQQAITLDELYGIDMNETLRGVNNLMKQFGLDAQTAMDYVVAGTQNGLDKTNELGDNIAEYAGKFAQAGYSAQEYFQLLNNGLDGGAYNLDKVNDAINEVTTRLSDGTMSEAIGGYSKDTQELFRSWQEGGASQKQVIDSIVADIKNATGQQEALTMAATAFGTMAEDGNLKFIESLTTVGDSYADVSGRAQEFFDSTTTNQQILDSAIRSAQEELAPLGEELNNLAAEIVPQLVSSIKEMTEGIDWQTLGSDIKGVIQDVFAFGDYILENKDLIIAGIAGVGAGFVAWNVATMIQGVVSSINAFRAANEGATIAQAALNVVMNANPIGILVTLIAGVVTALVTFIATNEEAREKIAEVWSNVKKTFSEATKNVKEAVGSAAESMKKSFGEGMETMKSVASDAWKYINGETSGEMSIMQAYVVNTWNAIKTTVQNAITLVKGIVKSGMQLLSGDWKGAWTTIKGTFTEIWDNIKGYAESATKNMYDAVSNKVKDTGKAIKDGLGDAVSYVKELPDKFYEWGKDMISNLVSGIRKKIGSVGDAIGDIADTIRSYIHFSEPDVGPLADFHTYMPDMTDMLVSGIKAGIPDIKKAMDDMASIMVPSYSASTPTVVVRCYNQTILDGKVISETVNEELGVVL